MSDHAFLVGSHDVFHIGFCDEVMRIHATAVVALLVIEHEPFWYWPNEVLVHQTVDKTGSTFVLDRGIPTFVVVPVE